MNKNLFIALLLLCGNLYGGSKIYAADEYSFIHLGSWAPLSINESAGIVGGGDPPSNIGYPGTPVLWHNGILTQLDAPVVNGAAYDINNSGRIVGFYNISNIPISSQNYAIYWESGTPHPLGMGAIFSVNNQNQMVGSIGSGLGVAGIWHDDGTWQDLGMGNSSQALSINDQGQILVNTSQGFYIWENGTAKEIKGISDGGYTYPSWAQINNQGMVVGTVWNSNTSDSRSFLWDGNQTLTFLPPTISFARAINDKGQIGGQTVDGAAFIWENGNIKLLQDLVPKDSGLTLTDVTAINNTGEIVGFAYDEQHNSVGFLMTPAVVPEPVSTVLMLLGGGTMLLRSRNKFANKLTTSVSS